VALGADRSSVIRTVLGRVVAILALGGGAGALFTAGTGPLISAVVLGVSPREPALLAAIALLIVVMSLLACAGPLRRSLRVDPLIALRDE
jgi:ABC-type antimicrobial peptide transport system permease subunit